MERIRLFLRISYTFHNNEWMLHIFNKQVPAAPGCVSLNPDSKEFKDGKLLPRGTINLANIKLLVHFEWNVYSVLQNYVQFNCARWFLLQFRLNKKHVCWNNLLSKFRLKSKYGCRAAEPGRAPRLHNVTPSGCREYWSHVGGAKQR